MRRHIFFALVMLVLLSAMLAAVGDTPPSANPSRILTTRFTGNATLPASAAGTKSLDVWLPIPSDSPWQTVTALTVSAPGAYWVTTEPRYGNRMVYLHNETPGKSFQVNVEFTVARQQVSVLDGIPKPTVLLTADLAPDSRVPVGGKFEQIATSVTRNDQTSLEKEHDLFRHVVSTMQYDYKKVSPKYAQGDSAFVCDYKSGNCSDLHSYLISLSRSLGIPAVLEFGYPLSGIPVAQPLPTDGKIAGYHCWTWFQDPQIGWVPLDAADARRWTDAGKRETADYLFGGLILERSAVAVSRGRDLILSPAQKAGPLNYFIYPYAEADGKSVPVTWELTYHVLSDSRR